MQMKRIFVVTAVVLAVLVLAGVFLLRSDKEGRVSDPAPTTAPPSTAELTAELSPSTAQAGPSSEPATQVSPSTAEPSTEPTAPPSSPPGETGTPQAGEPTPTTAPPQPAPTEVTLDCCQCTALGRDQHVPFRPEPGYTCEELCMRGCLERKSETVCKMGGVGGYAVPCPESP